MRSAVIVLVKCGKDRFKRNDMHVIIVLDQSPKTIGHTVYSADNVFILIKRAVFRGTTLNLFPEFLRKFSTGSCIVIRIYRTLFLAGKIKGYAADFDVSITQIFGVNVVR